MVAAIVVVLAVEEPFAVVDQIALALEMRSNRTHRLVGELLGQRRGERLHRPSRWELGDGGTVGVRPGGHLEWYDATVGKLTIDVGSAEIVAQDGQ